MSQSPNDSGIPVLTEIISSPTSGTPAPAPATTPKTAMPLPNQPSPPPTAAPAMLLSEEAWEKLERGIRERVLHQVLERIDFVLEQRVRDSLADVLQTAVSALAVDIHNGLHHSLQDVITRAVTQEISKLRSSKT